MSTISEKAQHVRAAAQDRNHACHWPGCLRQVPPALWGCAQHWYRLPLALRNKIWAAYRIRQEDDMRPSRAYLEVAHDVQAWIAAELLRELMA